MAATSFPPGLYPAHATKSIHLIRHGQGYHNVAGEMDYGAYMSAEYFDAALTPMGWQQTTALKNHIHNLPGGLQVDLVVVSPLMRTLQTAAGVFGSGKVVDGDSQTPLMLSNVGKSEVGPISSKGCPPFVAVEMCREHLGVHPCDRRNTLTSYQDQFPSIDFSLVETDEDTWWHADVRESEEQLTARGQLFCQWLMNRNERNIAVVSHSSFLLHMLSLFGNDCEANIRRSVQNGYANCEMRSLILVNRSNVISPHHKLDFPGGPGPDKSSTTAEKEVMANGNVGQI
eukprot:SM000334S12540  [mRNA]  locus=s334:51136:53698:- [translate_table: standard]